MVWFDAENFSLVGHNGSLEVPDEDEITYNGCSLPKITQLFIFQ